MTNPDTHQPELPIDWPIPPEITADGDQVLAQLMGTLTRMRERNQAAFQALRAQGRMPAPHVVLEAHLDALIELLALSPHDLVRYQILVEQRMTDRLAYGLSEVTRSKLIQPGTSGAGPGAGPAGPAGPGLLLPK